MMLKNGRKVRYKLQFMDDNTRNPPGVFNQACPTGGTLVSENSGTQISIIYLSYLKRCLSSGPALIMPLLYA